MCGPKETRWSLNSPGFSVGFCLLVCGCSGCSSAEPYPPARVFLDVVTYYSPDKDGSFFGAESVDERANDELSEGSHVSSVFNLNAATSGDFCSCDYALLNVTDQAKIGNVKVCVPNRSF